MLYVTISRGRQIDPNIDNIRETLTPLLSHLALHALCLLPSVVPSHDLGQK